MKQIGLALHNYHDVHNTFPPDAIWTSNRYGVPGTVAAQAGQQRNFTWIALVLPFVEQGPLHGQINFGLPALGQVTSDGTPLQSVLLDNFLCPSDQKFKALPHGFGYTSYAGNAGWDSHRRVHGDERLAGVFTLIDSVGIADIRDGTSNVIMVGEVTNRSYCCRNTALPISEMIYRNGRARVGTGEPVFRSLLVAPAAWTNTHVWIDAPTGPGPLLRADGSAGPVWGSWASPHAFPPVYYPHYHQNVEWPGAGSKHTGGAMYTICDGSVKFISGQMAGIGNNAGTPIRDPYGRYGCVYIGAHMISGIPDKTIVNFP